MAAISQVCNNKRARDEYWNGGIALPDAKKVKSGRLAHDSYLMALLEKIDNMDANPEPHAVIQLKDERLNGVMKSAEDERGLIGRAAVIDEKGGTELGSTQRGELTDSYSEVISVCDTVADMPSEGNYVDVMAELYNTAGELGVTLNLFDSDSTGNMCWDPVYAEVPVDSYGSLWEDDIWQLNESTIFQNGF